MSEMQGQAHASQFLISKNQHVTTFFLLLVRLAQHFLKKAKGAKKVDLAELVSSFFKDSGGVGTRKAFLPPKKASSRSLKTGCRSKVHGPTSTRTSKSVPWMQKRACILFDAIVAFFQHAA